MINESDFENSIPQEYSSDIVYTHSCFMSLFSGMLNWIADVLYPRIQYKVISTYDKAVEVFKKKQQNVDGQVNTNFLPALTLDPVLDFSNEERAGRFYWMFKNLDHRWYLKPWKTIRLVKQGAAITPMFTRYQGTVEVTAWLTSIYEYIDYRTRLIQYCGGYQRWIRPECFWTHLILPEEIAKAHTGDHGPINWDAINPDLIILETTTERVLALPFQLDAIWRLDSCGDSSQKMGGDQIAEYKCNATFTWECNIPTFIRFQDYQYPIETIKLNVGMTPAQAKYPLRNGFSIFKKIDPYRNIIRLVNMRCIYNIDDKTAKPAIVIPPDSCKSYPETYLDFCHYVVGKLYDIKKLNDPDDIKDIESILVIDEYKDEYLPYIRRCRGLITKYDNEKNVDLMYLIKNYKISTIYDIKNEQLFNAILTLHGKDITFDPLGLVIYLGKHKVKRWKATDDFSEFTFNHNIISILKRFNLEDDLKNEYMLPVGSLNIQTILSSKPVIDCLKFNCTQDQHEFTMPFLIPESCKKDFSIKVNNKLITEYNIEDFKIILNDKITINEGDSVKLCRNCETKLEMVRLICNHQMTRQDEIDYITSKKLIEIDTSDFPRFDPESLYCISYNGLMNKESDYIYDEQNKTITFKIEPHRDCFIQIFG